MSDQKLCRLCLNTVPLVSTSILSGGSTKQILTSIFPGLNTSLTTSLRLCEECFNNVNFAHRVKEAFREKEKEFSNAYYGSFCKRSYCSLCFRFETKDVIFLHKHNYSNESFKDIIDITLSESKIITDDKNICCFCWSWIKKIYSFKKRCFKMEESLKLYSLEMGLLTLTDKNLEEFLYRQYCNKFKNIVPQYSSDKNVNTAELSNLHLLQDKVVNLESFENEYDDDIEIKYNDPTDTSQSSRTETVTNNTKADETNTDTNNEYDADDEFDESVVRKLDNNFIVISDEEDDNAEPNTSLNKRSGDGICIDLNENNTSSMGETPDNMDLSLNTEYQNQQQTNCNSIKSNTKPNSTNTHRQLTVYGVTIEASIDLTGDNLQVLYCGTSEYSKIYENCNKDSEVTLPNHQKKKDQLRAVESMSHNKAIDIIPCTNNRSLDTYLVDFNQNSPLCINKMNNNPNLPEDDDECIIVNEDIETTNCQQLVQESGLLKKDEDCFEVLNASCDKNKACDSMETKTVKHREKPIIMDLSLEKDYQNQQKQISNSIKSITKPNSTNTNRQLTIYDVTTEASIDLTGDNLHVLYCGTSEYCKIYESCKKDSEVTSPNHQKKKDQFRAVESMFHNKAIDIIPCTNNRSLDTNLVDFNQNIPLCINNMNNKPNLPEDDDECIIVNEDIETTNSQQPVEDSGLLEKDEDCFEVLNASCDKNIACDSMETNTVENSSRKKSSDLKSYYVWGCHICVAKFVDKSKTRKHMMSHEEPWNKYGRFQCKKCPFRASWKGSVTRHKTLHTKDYFIKFFGRQLKYFCPYCSHTFDAKKDIKTHINEHVVSWKKFQCGECMFSSNNSDALRFHYSKNHTKAKDPTFAPAVNWEAAYQYLIDK